MKKLLFITRNYPPTVGGMETYSYDYHESISSLIATTLVANKRGKVLIPLFLIKAVFHIIFYGRKYTTVHLADGSLSILLPIIRIFTRSKVLVTVHGLDITYPVKFYQAIVPSLIAKADVVICVSENTKRICNEKGISKSKCKVLPNGIRFSDLPDCSVSFAELEKKYAFSTEKKRVLFSVGRLIKRKGHVWFLSHVMPKLPKNYIYLLAGIGPEEEHIREVIQKKKLQNNVILLGRVTDDEKICFYKNSDVFLMPNIHVPGDAEGFGITIIEAASYGLPALASDVDGISTAVVASKTGWLVQEKNEKQFLNHVKKAIPKSTVTQHAKKHFAWSNLAKQYLEVMQ